MNPHLAPRHYLPTAALPGAGLPNDRMAHLAARKAFVELKSAFLEAVHGLTDNGVEWLRRQVRSAEDPVDLWLLRASVFAALAGSEPERRTQRLRLRRCLDSLFPDPDAASGFGSL